MSSLRIGLTGGVAAGKSTVAAAFSDLGVPVFSADAVAHELTAPGQPALAAIRDRFGEPVFHVDGTLDREALSRIVFTDVQARRDLETLLHPAIRACLQSRADGCEAPYCVLEIPLLEDHDLGTLVDRVLVIEAPEPERLRRLIARDGRSEAEAGGILAAQSNERHRHAMTDDLIENRGGPGVIEDAVAHLDALYRDIAARGDPGRPGLRLPAT